MPAVRFHLKPLAAAAMLACALPGFGQTYTFGYSAGWLAQIGVTSAIETTAAGGKGILLGFIDSGVAAAQPNLAGRVSSASSCAAVSFKCPNGAADDNGHGTAVAAIAAGAPSSGKIVISGVAPKASILAEKALSAQGSGTDADVANGILKAANAGANVINLSLTYGPNAAIVNAINYAAGKGAIIVWAGGNDNRALNQGANTVGLSQAALSRLVLVGAVNSSNAKASFSNIPGAGLAVAGSTKIPYAKLWLMAPGVNIVAPGIEYGANSYAYWSGTSMATPAVAGAIALVEATWPILVKNGTATALLFQTATDLGSKGIDNTFGNGLLNLDAAFKPVGTLSVTSTSGKPVAVSTLTGGILSGGALGSLSALRSVLSSYTAFDGFQRNFIVDLSSLVTTKSTSAGAAVAAAAQAPVSTGYRYDDGSQAVYLRWGEPNAGDAPWAFSFTNRAGMTLAAGAGIPAQAGFAEALWGGAAADQSRHLGVSGAVTGLADGGRYVAFGRPLSEDARLAFAWAMPKDWVPDGLNPAPAKATALSVGLTSRLARDWSAGLTLGWLDEPSSLLGTSYGSGSALSLGNQHRSTSMTLSSSYDLGDLTKVLVDLTLARTDGASLSSGLVGSVSPLSTRAYGISLARQSAYREDDTLSLTLRKPLRVVAGHADVVTMGVGAEGDPLPGSTRVSLVPSGNETDLVLGYSLPVRKDARMALSLSARQDAGNIAGNHDVMANLGLNMRF